MRSELPGGPATLRLAAVLVVAVLTVSACRTVTSETAAPGATTPPPSETAAAGATADAGSSPTPVNKTMCQSGEDLAVDVAFLRSIDVSEDGVLSLIVGVDTALGEAQLLADLGVDEYRPLVEDTIVALQDLRDVGDDARDQETIGAGVAIIGEAITDVGEAMEALETQLREPCPEQIS